MNKPLQDCLKYFGATAKDGISKNSVAASRFVDVADEAGAVFAGIKVPVELIEVNRLMAQSSDEAEVACALDGNDEGSLLSMVRVVSGLMADRVEGLVTLSAGRAASEVPND